jgi:hypothetical protein
MSMMPFHLSDATKKEIVGLTHAARWHLANDLVSARNALLGAEDIASAKHMSNFIEWLREPKEERLWMCDPQCRHIRGDHAVKAHAGLCVGSNGGRRGYGSPGLARKRAWKAAGKPGPLKAFIRAHVARS